MTHRVILSRLGIKDPAICRPVIAYVVMGHWHAVHISNGAACATNKVHDAWSHVIDARVNVIAREDLNAALLTHHAILSRNPAAANAAGRVK